jgi:hypothetical protein
MARNGRRGAPGKGHTPSNQTRKRRAATTYMAPAVLQVRGHLGLFARTGGLRQER